MGQLLKPNSSSESPVVYSVRGRLRFKKMIETYYWLEVIIMLLATAALREVRELLCYDLALHPT